MKRFKRCPQLSIPPTLSSILLCCPHCFLPHTDWPSPDSQDIQPQVAYLHHSGLAMSEERRCSLTNWKSNQRNYSLYYSFQFHLLRVEVEFAYFSVALTINMSKLQTSSAARPNLAEQVYVDLGQCRDTSPRWFLSWSPFLQLARNSRNSNVMGVWFPLKLQWLAYILVDILKIFWSWQ